MEINDGYLFTLQNLRQLDFSVVDLHSYWICSSND